MIHIGDQKTKTTLCGKPVARRWWVDAPHYRYGIGPGNLRVFEFVRPVGSTCKMCIEALS